MHAADGTLVATAEPGCRAVGGAVIAVVGAAVTDSWVWTAALTLARSLDSFLASALFGGPLRPKRLRQPREPTLPKGRSFPGWRGLQVGL
jgi:hypothetical protein